MGVSPLRWGRVGRQTWEVRGGVVATQHSLFETKSHQFKKVCAWYGVETGEIPMLRTFLAKSWVFTYFSRNTPIFSFARDIWRHTPWPILVIEVSMVGGDQYLSIYTKIKFIKSLVAKIQGGLQPPPPLIRYTKNTLVRRGLSNLQN